MKINSKDIIAKLEKNNLLGRGGASFPTGLKWEMVRCAKAAKKYIICNGSEGEPNVFKDGFILENYPEAVIEGIKIALETINNSFAYIYLRKDYYEKFKEGLKKLIGEFPIMLFKKTGGYIAGEETSIIEAIEGKRPEPRIKPPFPAQCGLWGSPTLINNVETFYYAAKIAKNEYKGTRFYSISGEAKYGGVYELPENYSILRVLKETENWPGVDPVRNLGRKKFSNFFFAGHPSKQYINDFSDSSEHTNAPSQVSNGVDFFVQAGGGAFGEILLPKELNQEVKGTGAIIVFDRKKTNPFSLMKKWVNFFLEGNCDKCVPCREGIYRINEMLEKGKIEKELLEDILFVLKETSFCSLGKRIFRPFTDLLSKICKI